MAAHPSPLSVSATSPWLANFRPSRQAKLRLFCLPYAGGSSLIYQRWPSALPPGFEVCPVHLPGRGTRIRETPYTHFEPLVHDISEALLPYLDKPFALFGHSMGALLSFELARQLRREHNLRPAQLFLSGRRAPTVTSLDPPSYNLPESEFIEAVRKLNGTPEEALNQPELMQLLLPLLRADFAVCETYVYSPSAPLDCPISVYGGLKDKGVTRQHLELWREHTTSAFTLRMLPGDHFFLNTSQPLLLRVLAQELDQLTAKTF